MKISKNYNFIFISFFALYMILPSYFAIELSAKLPLITASRILLILLIGYYVIKNNFKIHTKIFEKKSIKKYFYIYFLCMIVTNLYYAFFVTDALKELFTIIVEELIVIWIISQVIDSRNKLNDVLKIISISSGIVAIIAVAGSITGYNLFYSLNTVSRQMLMSDYYRLGFIRASAGFGHAVYYGLYCIIMIVIAMFLIENEKKNGLYKIIFVLNLIGLFFSNSRGTMLVFIFLCLYMFGKKKYSDTKKYISIIVVGMMMVLIVFTTSNKIQTFFDNVIGSIMNVFFPESVVLSDYGGNSQSGIESRLNQFSMVKYAISQNPFFGLGAGAHMRNVQMWYNTMTHKWQMTDTYDVGYFAIICMYGGIGLIGNISLYIGLIKNIYSKELKKDKIIQMFKYVFVGYMASLFSVTGLDSVLWLMIGLFISYLNILEKENMQKNSNTIERN